MSTNHNPRVGGSSPSSGISCLALGCGFAASGRGLASRTLSQLRLELGAKSECVAMSPRSFRLIAGHVFGTTTGRTPSPCPARGASISTTAPRSTGAASSRSNAPGCGRCASTTNATRPHAGGLQPGPPIRRGGEPEQAARADAAHHARTSSWAPSRACALIDRLYRRISTAGPIYFSALFTVGGLLCLLPRFWQWQTGHSTWSGKTVLGRMRAREDPACLAVRAVGEPGLVDRPRRTPQRVDPSRPAPTSASRERHHAIRRSHNPAIRNAPLSPV
jgi:hypothetical protein